MGLATLRTQVKNKLAGVTGVGKTHDYLRWWKDRAGFVSLFKHTDGKVNAWQVTRRSTASAQIARYTAERVHEFMIVGVYGLDDSAATEKTFQDLVEAICDAFDLDADLGGNTHLSGPARVQVVEPRLFGDVLCHYAEIIVSVREEKTYTV